MLQRMPRGFSIFFEMKEYCFPRQKVLQRPLIKIGIILIIGGEAIESRVLEGNGVKATPGPAGVGGGIGRESCLL